MRAKVIFKREMSSFFTSPVAYIVMGLFLLISGFLFFSTFFLYDKAEMRGFFSLLPLLFAFFIPAITMRLFAEEKKSGTIETLITMPFSSREIVFGKFLSGLAFTAVMLLPTLIYVFTVARLGELDPGPVVSGYLGALFLAAAFTAIGLYCSFLTKNQIVAFFVAFSICIVLVLLDNFLILLPSVLVDVFEFISAGSHFNSIARGILDSRDIVYFLSVTAAFLVKTSLDLEERRGL